MVLMNPLTPEELARLIRDLHTERYQRKLDQKVTPRRRYALKRSEREQVLAKTAGHCHICGGSVVGTTWNADHVLAHSTGGAHTIDNYLPAHGLCNNYRWDYSAEEFQLILKLGVWAKTQIEQWTKV